MWLICVKLFGLSLGTLLGFCCLYSIKILQETEWKAKKFSGDKADSWKHVWLNVNITTEAPKFTNVSKRHVNKNLHSIQKLCSGCCAICCSVELQLLMSEARWETRWVKHYTQIILKNQSVNFHSLSQNLQPVTRFGYIYNLLMTGRWEVYTEFSQKSSREDVSSETWAWLGW